MLTLSHQVATSEKEQMIDIWFELLTPRGGLVTDEVRTVRAADLGKIPVDSATLSGF